MTSFLELFHTDKHQTCADRGWDVLDDADQCSDAVLYAKSFDTNARYLSELSLVGIQKGCVYFPLTGDMYFNTHATECIQDCGIYQSICTKK